ncbi:MAG: hypothetical protein EOP51_17040 [Sphingobacteriales bacterium]|nr:MAG: hypothetical protein EOP51_17040 [Sphingobacteriales bacterium]
MEVKEIEIADDILTVCVLADHFPLGVKAAYDKLGAMVGRDKPRELYGVTEMADGNIVYRACVNKLAGDDKLKLAEYLIPKGIYLYTTLEWEGNEHRIGSIFAELVKHPGVKQNTIGLEHYYVTPKEARLMVQKKV